MTDNEIIVCKISGQQIARILEDAYFYGYSDEEIVDELIGKYGKDITIKRVLYDEENIPCNYFTLYDSDYQYEEEEEEEGEDDEEEDNRESEFEIYWDDLTEDCQKALLKAAGVKSPKEEMWDRFPVTIVYLD